MEPITSDKVWLGEGVALHELFLRKAKRVGHGGLLMRASAAQRDARAP
jgi:hypothetical protein